MFNFIHHTNIFGYSTTQLFTKLFPSQIFIYNHYKVLVCQSSFNTSMLFTSITKDSLLACLFVINIYFVLEILSGNLFAVSRGARRNFLRGAEILRKIFRSHQSTGYLIYYNIYARYTISILTHQHFSWPGLAATSVFSLPGNQQWSIIFFTFILS